MEGTDQEMEGCFVRLGEEKTAGAAFVASGCGSILDFLSSPLLWDAAPTLVLLSNESNLPFDKGALHISVEETRDREEAREAGSFVRFLHAFPTCLPPSCSSLYILDVQLISMEELSALCSGIASPRCALSSLSLSFLSIEPQLVTGVTQSTALDLLKDALCNNTSLTSLSLGFFVHSLIGSAQGWLIPALTRPPPCASSIKQLFLRYHVSADPSLDDVSEILQGLACNTISLTCFEISILPRTEIASYHGTTLELLGTMLYTNTSLQTLELNRLYLPGEVVERLFASLEQNAHLTSLSLRCYGPGWPSASFVLDSLRVNGIVTYLDLNGTPLYGESKAAINAQLARNKQRAEQLKVEGASTLVPPNTVRLFLCGLPFSGKTTLSRSLVKWNKGACNHARCLPLAPAIMLERTRGIEVSALEKDGVKVSLWDMAGQEQYYAFHDYMFPNLSDDGTPSLFLFVWNPMLLDKETNKEIKDRHGKSRIKTPDMFEHEFRYWLRFIASKTLKSLKFRPNLFVAVTRADLLPIQAKTWITSSFEKCQNDFQEHIQFDMEGVFEIDARDPSHVKGLGLCILERATSILKVKPAIYQACNHARLVLVELVLAKRLAPVITKEKFFYVCKKHLDLYNREMQEAVALSLHEFGDLIYFKELELVVIDTRWFCHELMGNLLYSFTDMEHQQYRGFFPVKYLESLLESQLAKPTKSGANQLKACRTIFAKRPTISPTVKGKDLVKLLIGLQLACQQDDGNMDTDVFIPASLCTVPRKRIDPSMFLKGADDMNIRTFLGRRLKCKDSICTFFTPGIFTPLQVAFNGSFNRMITLNEGVMAFSQSGVKVFVEFCKHEGRDHFIDVLIHSRLDLDNTIAWAYEKVLDKMENICAQPRGIQGVELVHEVIRPRSVKELDCMEERSICTAVSLEELRKTLRDALEKRGIDLPDCLNTVFHDWYPTNDSDRVIDLLGNVETLQVVKEHTHKFILDAENVLGINIEEGLVCSTSEPKKRVFSSTNSGIEREWIYDEVHEARKDIQKVQKEISKVLAEVQRISNGVLPQIRQSVQALLTFGKEGEAGKLPRLFVVTKDNAGMVHEIVGAMVPSLQNVRLELLCEHQAGPHLVPKQRGIRFSTLEDGLLKQGLPYINMFLKLASMAVKVAAHVTSGLGDFIPDFSHVLAMIVDTPEFPSLPALLDFQAPIASRANFQEGQRWLFGVLFERDCVTSTRIHEVFGLSRVRCRADSHIRWLCDKHCSEGELCP